MFWNARGVILIKMLMHLDTYTGAYSEIFEDWNRQSLFINAHLPSLLRTNSTVKPFISENCTIQLSLHLLLIKTLMKHRICC